MIITRRWLENHNACAEGREWFLKENVLDLSKGVKNLLAKDHFTWANWLLTRVLTKNKKIQYAIYAAKQVLYIYEKKYPKDLRPRNAIKAALGYLKNPAADAANAAANAADAASGAAYAASYAAYAASDPTYAANAANAAYAASDATYAANAAYAAYAASYAASDPTYVAGAAYVANAAANAANAADAAGAQIALRNKIIAYGLKLVKKGDK